MSVEKPAGVEGSWSMKANLLGLVLALSAFVFSTAAADCTTSPPLFDLTGPMCIPSKLLTPCQCSEAMFWDPVPTAMWYEIQRTPIPSGYTIMVGTTQTFEPVRDPEEQGPPITHWYFAWDCIDHSCAFPEKGKSYNYRTRGCRVNEAGMKLCGSWSVTTTYTAAAYYCYGNGAKVPC